MKVAVRDTITVDYKILKHDPLDVVFASGEEDGRFPLSTADPSRSLGVTVKFQVAQIAELVLTCSNVDVLVRGHNEEKDKNTGFIDVPYSHCDDKFKGKEERTFMIKPFDKNYVDQMTVTLTNVEHSRNPRVLTISKLYLAQKRPAPGTTSRSVPRVCESASVFKPTNTLPGPPHKRGTETVPHRQYIPSNDQTHLPDSELRRAMAASMESYKRESQRKPGHGPSDGKEEVEVEEEKVMIKNEVPPPKKSAPQPLTKVFTNIGEDGWCTPWAEELDLVNIFFIGIREGTRQREAEEYARRLGAGVTENSALATHVLTDPDFEPEILKDSVKDGQRVVNVDWLIQCWKLKKYVPEQEFEVNVYAGKRKDEK